MTPGAPAFEANVFLKKDIADASADLRGRGYSSGVKRLEEAYDSLGYTQQTGTNAVVVFTAEDMHSAVIMLQDHGYKINYICVEERES